MEILKKKTIGEAFRFGIVGVIATAINWIIYWILQHWVNINIAYAAGFMISIACNYYLSSYFTFRKKATIANGIGFITAHTLAFLIRLVLLNVFVFIGVKKDFAAIPVDIIAVPINFILVRFGFNYKK